MFLYCACSEWIEISMYSAICSSVSKEMQISNCALQKHMSTLSLVVCISRSTAQYGITPVYHSNPTHHVPNYDPPPCLPSQSTSSNRIPPHLPPPSLLHLFHHPPNNLPHIPRHDIHLPPRIHHPPLHRPHRLLLPPHLPKNPPHPLLYLRFLVPLLAVPAAQRGRFLRYVEEQDEVWRGQAEFGGPAPREREGGGGGGEDYPGVDVAVEEDGGAGGEEGENFCAGWG